MKGLVRYCPGFLPLSEAGNHVAHKVGAVFGYAFPGKVVHIDNAEAFGVTP